MALNCPLSWSKAIILKPFPCHPYQNFTHPKSYKQTRNPLMLNSSDARRPVSLRVNGSDEERRKQQHPETEPRINETNDVPQDAS